MQSAYHQVGHRLKRDIISHAGTLLIPADTILTKEHIEHIIKHGYYLTEDDIVIEEAIDNPGQNQIGSEMVEEATVQMKHIFEFVRYSNRIPLMDIRNKVIPAVQQSVSNPSLLPLLSQLQSKDDYTYRHNIGVAVISTLIGKWLRLSDRDLQILTVAAILHDIGKTKIPEEILQKPGKFTSKEFNHMKKHTVYGYELIKKTVGTSHRIALVALQHHEREDGSGYPFGLKGSKIDYLSKIVAVADVFHAMTSKRVYHDASPFFKVMNQMKQDVYGKLEPKIVTTFVQRLMELVVGGDVVLTDGRRATIVRLNPQDPTNPLVRVQDGEFIDLSQASGVHVEKFSFI